jgi:hypothetical protein
MKLLDSTALRSFWSSECGALRAIVQDAPSLNATLSVTELNDAEMTAANAFVAPTSIWLKAEPSGFSVSNAVLPSLEKASTPPTSAANSIYQAGYHEIFYVWTITRPGGSSSTFAPVGPHGYNMPTAWNNRNVMYGPLITLCFTEPGTHTVDLWAVDPAGNTATWTKAWTVLNPDTVYAGNLTVCVQPVGDADTAWCPAGAQIVTTGATDIARTQAALTLYNASPSGTSRRLLLKGGATYDLRVPAVPGTAVLNYQTNSTSKRHYIAGYGGQATILHGDGNGFTGSRDTTTPSQTIANITFQGDWDEETETYLSPRIAAGGGVGAQTDTHWTLHRINMTGARLPFAPGSDNTVAGQSTRFFRRYVLSESCITNWNYYGIFVNQPVAGPMGNAVTPDYPTGRGPFAMSWLGSKFVRSPLSLTAGDKWCPDEIHNSYGVMRSIYLEWFHAACTDAFMPGFYQPIMRGPSTLMENNTTKWNPWIYNNFDRTVWEGSVTCLGIANSGPGSGAAGVSNTVIDKLLAIATSENDQLLFLTPGVTARNVVAVVPGTDRTRAGSIRSVFDVPGSSSSTDTFAFAHPLRIHNCTGIFLRTTTDNNGTVPVFRTTQASLVTGIVSQNNVFHAPSAGTDAGAFTSATLAGVTPRYVGLNTSFQHTDLTLSNVANGATFDVFYTSAGGSPFINRTTFDGRLSTSAPTQNYWTVTNPTHNMHLIYSVNAFGGAPSTGTVYFDGGLSSGARITAQYLSDRIRFTNNTGTTLNSFHRLKVDIRGLHPGPNATFATGSTALSWLPSGANVARNGYSSGLLAQQDFLGNFRSGKRNLGGSIVSGTADTGAFEVA